MFTLCFGVCINKSMWYNSPTYGKALNPKETQLRKDNKQPRNFTGGGGTGKDKIECCECTVSVAGQIPQPLVIGEM